MTYTSREPGQESLKAWTGGTRNTASIVGTTRYWTRKTTRAPSTATNWRKFFLASGCSGRGPILRYTRRRRRAGNNNGRNRGVGPRNTGKTTPVTRKGPARRRRSCGNRTTRPIRSGTGNQYTRRTAKGYGVINATSSRNSGGRSSRTLTFSGFCRSTSPPYGRRRCGFAGSRDWGTPRFGGPQISYLCRTRTSGKPGLGWSFDWKTKRRFHAFGDGT